MYSRILVGLDGSPCSRHAAAAGLELADATGESDLIGCHVYAARMHRTRFEDMESGLPPTYQDEDRLEQLRTTHDDLIGDGLRFISDAYLAPLAQIAAAKGVPFRGLAPEGRNYVELLRLVHDERPGLTILGATGMGAYRDLPLGSCAERVLLHAPAGDVLLVRRPWSLRGRPIVVGIDGSEDSYVALDRAIGIAVRYNAPLEGVAVYDPFFHAGVFRTIADALPDDAQKKFNFPAQEKLHDEIIDRGLEGIYRDALERGAVFAKSRGVEMRTSVIAGKVAIQLHHYAALRNAGLMVLGRWGLHREPPSLIGSVPHTLARISGMNVLVVGTGADLHDLPPKSLGQSTMEWDPDAIAILDRIPHGARPMAKRAIEEQARSAGATKVTAAIVREAAERFGMGGGS